MNATEPSAPSPVMMLPSRHYESEHTKFIRELMEKKPELALEQQRGRALWWDKQPQDLDERRRMDEGLVPQAPYVYQTSD
jgi:hypothetical protein